MHRLKSLKEKTLFLCVNGLGRKAWENFARYLKANINCVYCTLRRALDAVFFFFFFNQYLSRGIQFSRASLTRALTQHKNKDIKTRKLIKLQKLTCTTGVIREF